MSQGHINVSNQAKCLSQKQFRDGAAEIVCCSNIFHVLYNSERFGRFSWSVTSDAANFVSLEHCKQNAEDRKLVSDSDAVNLKTNVCKQDTN